MSNMCRSIKRSYCRENGVEFKPKHPSKKKWKCKQTGFSLRNDPGFNQYSLASAMMVVAGMMAMKQKRTPNKAA